MTQKLSVFLWSGLLLLLGLVVGAKYSYAANFQGASDLISTSRPSASAPLNAAQIGAATNVTTVDNGSIYLASDSARFLADTGETEDAVNVSTMSAQIVGSPNTRLLSFTGPIQHLHHAGDAVIVPITAMHKIQVKINTALTTGNHLIIIFPGAGSNIASPSATTFSFNGLTTANAANLIKVDGTGCSAITVAAPSIDCTISGGAVSSGTTVTFLIGCSANSLSNCTTQSPFLINPTKSATNSCNTGQATCTADTWKIVVKSQISGIDQDVSGIKIGTIESVQVSANVEPSLTFQIAGIANGVNINTIAPPSCTASELTNSGVDSTATNVNLGNLVNGTINIAAQKAIVSTNGSTGYVLTATSSGVFIDTQLGFWLPDANGGNGLTANDAPPPATFNGTPGTPAFGINACGTNVLGQWVNNGVTGFGSGAKYSNPWNTSGKFFYNTLSSAVGAVSNDTTVIRYAATVSGTTPAGTYTTVLTYVATATF